MYLKRVPFYAFVLLLALSTAVQADKVDVDDPAKRELSPESEIVFFIKDSPRSTYTFMKDDTGQALLVVKQDDREVWRGKKIK